MQPYYFPFVRVKGGLLEGFFDYRPRNEQEATVQAHSNDWGVSWVVTSQALGLNPYCPLFDTDPDNQFVNVGGVKTAYGSDPNAAGDNGLGHPVVLTVNGVQRLYNLNRANGHIDSDQLVVHTLPSAASGSLSSLPDFGYVSPLASASDPTKGYPTLESTALATTGLKNPDAIIGAIDLGTTTAVIYVQKQLNVYPKSGPKTCSGTPPFALTNLINGSSRKANLDKTTVRVATTTDGINFTDFGPATGLNNPDITSLEGIRYFGSGSIIKLGDGRIGMFFGAGGCLDNDSDGFHFIGYAETTGKIKTPYDLTNLLTWKIIHGSDNPILSTDTVIDTGASRSYPANSPVINVTGMDALKMGQVGPWMPPAGYNTNFFSGRVYDPQVVYTDEKTLTIIFAGYNTPQPSNNLADYRTIGRFQLKVVPAGYFSQF
jgi:hypothetical protein